VAEIVDWEHKARNRGAFYAGLVSEVQITESREVETFVRLISASRLSPNECSEASLAVHRGYRIALDCNQALSKAIAEANVAVAQSRRQTVSGETEPLSPH
jgi:hypothetical protein